jgi:hypothetical protein
VYVSLFAKIENDESAVKDSIDKLCADYTTEFNKVVQFHEGW